MSVLMTKKPPNVHYDTKSKSVIVNKPDGITKNAKKIVKNKAKSTQEKSFECGDKMRTVGQENKVEAKNEGHIDSMKESNALRGDCHEGIEKVTDLDEKTNPHEIGSEIITMIRKTLMRQGKKDQRAVHLNARVTKGTVGSTFHEGYTNTVEGGKEFSQNTQKILTKFKMRKSDHQEKNMFGKAEIHGLSIEYAFKVFFYKGLRILFDTGGQPLFS